MKQTWTFLIVIIFSLMLFSCSKDAGDGGNSTIYGKVIVYNYNAEFTKLRGIYPGADENVYLIYGNNRSYSERIKCNYNGIYEFKYLRPGDYTIYVYSKDSTLTLVSGTYPVIKNVSIKDKKQTLEVEDIKIFK